MKRLMSTALSCSLLFSMQSSAQASIRRINFTDGSILHVMQHEDLPDMINILNDLIQKNQEKRPPDCVKNTCSILSAAAVPIVIFTASGAVVKKIISKSKGENLSLTPYVAVCGAGMALLPSALVCQGVTYFLNRSLVYDANHLKSVRDELTSYNNAKADPNKVFFCLIRNLEHDRAKNRKQKSAVYSVNLNDLSNKVYEIKSYLKQESRDIKVESFTTISKADDVNQENSKKSQEFNKLNNFFEGVKREFEKD